MPISRARSLSWLAALIAVTWPAVVISDTCTEGSANPVIISGSYVMGCTATPSMCSSYGMPGYQCDNDGTSADNGKTRSYCETAYPGGGICVTRTCVCTR